MRAVLTRVDSASVAIGGEVKASIGKGFLVLLGVHEDDTAEQADKIADKICGLRIFEDEAGKMNLNPETAGAELLIISQFSVCRLQVAQAGLFKGGASGEGDTALRKSDRKLPQAGLFGRHRRVRSRDEGQLRKRRSRYDNS